MIHVKKILVPVDFSWASKKAVDYGLSFALEFKARLALAHIAPFDPLAYDKAKQDLLDLIPAEHREELNFETIVKSGSVHDELLGMAEQGDVDLVIMGSHGRPYLQRMLLGSVTEGLLRQLHVPILTVSHLDPAKEIHTPGPVPLKRILYATDLAEGSEEGLEFSVRLAHGLDANLMVLHVIRFTDAAFHGMDTAAFLPEYAEEVRAEAAERLSRMVGLVSDGSVPVTTLLADGVPSEVIERVAVQRDADLIVIDLQKKGRIERAMLGTTAERVIRSATVPVLSLPLPANYKTRWEAA